MVTLEPLSEERGEPHFLLANEQGAGPVALE